ncbi:Sec-independent protein translocase protein TatB [Vogesella urethralis]|uniref:Sec-independent protein translocase protein TatB n=1 Tax=Vogesella urethralis TaxID=2592656 RepID=UPI001184B22C|nr:Sec-independent protein translocase protein TatB [Vogesella urethralis]
MFEISFGELLVIGAVALVVLGPERLPTVARTIGALVGRAQRFVASVKSDIHQQSQMAGLHELKQDIQDAADAFRTQVEREAADVRQVAQDISYSVEPVQQAVQETVADVQQAVQADADDDHRIAPADMLAAAGIAPAEPAAKDDGQLDLFAQPVPDAATPLAASSAESRS